MAALPPSQSATQEKKLEDDEDSEEDVMEKWDSLEHTLDRVVQELLARDVRQPPFTHGKLLPRHDYISLYQQIYDFLSRDRGVADEYGNKLFNKYEQIVQTSIQTIFQTEIRPKRESASVGLMQRNDMTVVKGEEGLETFVGKVKAFKQKMHVLSHTFSYMERYFIPRKSLPTLEEVANTQLNEQVLKRVAQQLMIELGALVEKRRIGKPVNDSSLLEVVAMFLGTKATNSLEEEEERKEMGPYEDLEAFLLQDTTLYYVKKAPHWSLDTLETKALEQVMQNAIAKRSLQKDNKKMSINFNNNSNASLFNCSIDLKIQDPTKTGVADALWTTNV